MQDGRSKPPAARQQTGAMSLLATRRRVSRDSQAGMPHGLAASASESGKLPIGSRSRGVKEKSNKPVTASHP